MNRPGSPHDSADEPARDAWLSEALRHAPDADAAPSVAVRETILRQARAAAATAPTPPRSVGAWQRLGAAWSWLSGPRVAAGFASVMVATVVGLMWWDRPIDEALRAPEPPATVSTPAATPAPAPAPAPVPDTPPATTAPPAPSAEAARDQAAATPPRATAQRKRETRPRDDAADERAKDTRREAPTAFAAPRAADEAGGRADKERAERAAQELGAAREQRSEAAQAKAAAPAPAPSPALRSAPAAAAGATQAPAAAVMAPAPAAPPVAAAAPLRQVRTAPLRALIEALGEESPRWRWQRDGAEARAVTPELQAWLQQLDRALAPRGPRAESAGQALAPDPGSTQELRLLRDGGVQAVVRFEEDGRIRIEIAGEAPLSARLAPAGASTLRRALDDATR